MEARVNRLARLIGLGPVGSSANLREVFSFVAVGGTGALIYVALNFFLSTVLDLRPSLSILVTLVLLVPPTYLAQRRITFRSDRDHADAFPRYLGTQLIGNGIAALGAEVFPDEIRRFPLLAFSIIAVIVATISYGCLKFWTFRQAK